MRIREARLADAGAIARVHIDTWRTAYAGIIPASFLAGMSYQAREERWIDILAVQRPAMSNFVAEVDRGTVAGFAGGGPERDGTPTYQGELYAAYLLPQYQRRGLGRSLVTAVAQHLLQHDFISMLVWVLADNHPAHRFYESLGGVEVSQKTITIGDVTLPEVSYGWRDISDLAAGPAR